MKNLLKIVIFVLLAAPVEANPDFDTIIHAWAVACESVEIGCEDVSIPPIAFTDTITIDTTGDQRTTRGGGGYDELTGTVWLLNGTPKEKLTGILIHEYVHHILHVSGEVVIDRDDIKTICESERLAFKLSHRWMRTNNKKHQIIRWKKYYPYCR